MTGGPCWVSPVTGCVLRGGSVVVAAVVVAIGLPVLRAVRVVAVAVVAAVAPVTVAVTVVPASSVAMSVAVAVAMSTGRHDGRGVTGGGGTGSRRDG